VCGGLRVSASEEMTVSCFIVQLFHSNSKKDFPLG
jgi:hypothetical protein